MPHRCHSSHKTPCMHNALHTQSRQSPLFGDCYRDQRGAVCDFSRRLVASVPRLRPAKLSGIHLKLLQ